MATIDISFELKGDNLVAIVLNNSDDSFQFLKWNTLFDAPYVHGLQVKRNDVALSYIGPYFKRIFDPTVSLVTISQGRYEFVFPLEEVFQNYDCDDTRQTDKITIDIADKPFLLYPGDDTGLRPLQENLVSSSEIEVSYPVLLRYYKKKIIDELSDVGAGYDDVPICVFGHNSGYEQLGPTTAHILGYPVVVQGALTSGQVTRLKAVVKLLFVNKPAISRVTNSTLYRRWFGPLTSANKDKVEATLRKLNRGGCPGYLVFNGATTGRCSADTYAFVIYDRTYNENPRQCSASTHHCHKLFLCPLFWNRPFRGIDSQVGILAHELSHAYSYTGDHVYGHSFCLTLARTNPETAIENADNFEYYVEELLR